MNKECEERVERIIYGFEECQNAFTAIGDQTRQLILITLLKSDLAGIRVGEIAKKTHLTRPSVSHHLQILKAAGIVSMKKDGTKNFYYISKDTSKWESIKDLINIIYDSIAHDEGVE